MLPCPGDVAGVQSGNLRAVPLDPPLPPPWTCDPAEPGVQGDPAWGGALRPVKGSCPVWIHTERVAPPSETGSVLSSDTRVGASG